VNAPDITREFLKGRQSLMAYVLALTRDRGVAEEVFQETALAILGEAGRGTRVRSFMPWAREIVRRRLAEHHRKSKRWTASPLHESMMDIVTQSFEETEPEPEQESRLLDHLSECLKKLSGRLRQAVELRYRDRYGIDQIASSMGMQVDSVHVFLSRGRRSLADCVRAKLSPAGD